MAEANKNILTVAEQEEVSATARWLSDFRYRNTANSTAIEGNILDFAATRRLLRGEKLGIASLYRGMTEGYAMAFDAAMDSISRRESLSEGIILKLHELVMMNDKIEGGKYRQQVVMVGGTIPPDPVKVPVLMGSLIEWYNGLILDDENIIPLLAQFHLRFEKIHPFLDGNGRVGRLLVNRELISHGYLPFDIPYEERQRYYQGFSEESVMVNLFQDAFDRSMSSIVEYLTTIAEYEYNPQIKVGIDDGVVTIENKETLETKVIPQEERISPVVEDDMPLAEIEDEVESDQTILSEINLAVEDLLPPLDIVTEDKAKDDSLDTHQEEKDIKTSSRAGTVRPVIEQVVIQQVVVEEKEPVQEDSEREYRRQHRVSSHIDSSHRDSLILGSPEEEISAAFEELYPEEELRISREEQQLRRESKAFDPSTQWKEVNYAQVEPLSPLEQIVDDAGIVPDDWKEDWECDDDLIEYGQGVDLEDIEDLEDLELEWDEESWGSLEDYNDEEYVPEDLPFESQEENPVLSPLENIADNADVDLLIWDESWSATPEVIPDDSHLSSPEEFDSSWDDLGEETDIPEFTSLEETVEFSEEATPSFNELFDISVDQETEAPVEPASPSRRLVSRPLSEEVTLNEVVSIDGEDDIPDFDFRGF